MVTLRISDHAQRYRAWRNNDIKELVDLLKRGSGGISQNVHAGRHG